jgi:hypothetical protein
MVRSEYQAKLQRHGGAVADLCHQLGFAFHRVVTSEPLELALHDFLRQRNRRGRRVRRHGQPASPS